MVLFMCLSVGFWTFILERKGTGQSKVVQKGEKAGLHKKEWALPLHDTGLGCYVRGGWSDIIAVLVAHIIPFYPQTSLVQTL